MLRIAINGFGRIGRRLTRLALQDGDVHIVAINDLHDAHTMAHLFKYDSGTGRLAMRWLSQAEVWSWGAANPLLSSRTFE